MGFRATLKLNLILLIKNNSIIGKNSPCRFEIEALKAEIKCVFSRSYCCYGNLHVLCHQNNTNVFTSDWAVF